MIMSVSTLMIGSGAATAVSVVNLSIRQSSCRLLSLSRRTMQKALAKRNGCADIHAWRSARGKNGVAAFVDDLLRLRNRERRCLVAAGVTLGPDKAVLLRLCAEVLFD